MIRIPGRQTRINAIAANEPSAIVSTIAVIVGSWKNLPTIDGTISCPARFLYIYESESSKTGNIESSTKTENGNRPVPCPEKIYENIKARFKFVVQYVSDHIEEYQRRISQLPADKQAFYPKLQSNTIAEFCMYLPIACKGYDYFAPTTSRRITDAGRRFFKDIGLDEDIFYFAEIKSREEEAENKIKIHDPSAYLFRRNYITHAYKCLMSMLPGTVNVHPIAALQFISGHQITFGVLDRQKMRDEKILLCIDQALSNRPYVNNLSIKTLKLGSGDNLVRHQLLHNEEIEITYRSDEKILIIIEVDEPHDNTTILFSASSQKTAHAEMFTSEQSSL